MDLLMKGNVRSLLRGGSLDVSMPLSKEQDQRGDYPHKEKRRRMNGMWRTDEKKAEKRRNRATHSTVLSNSVHKMTIPCENV